jgi:hypothetical protein
VRRAQPRLLAGLIVSASGEPVYAAHAVKKTRYRNQVSSSLQPGKEDQTLGRG